MTGSHPNPEYSAQGIRKFLAEALPHSQVVLKQRNAKLEPLVILQTDHVVAAFALSNGDFRKSYAALYDDFKLQFAEEQNSWNAMDLAFVFCVQPALTNIEQFCSSVETDVYFCRKFVVPLSAPIGNSLARLPFLPLAPLEGTTLRPPSAQTFLVNCGVPQVLSRHIVVQGERGAERLIEDCVAGTYGMLAELSTSKTALPIPQDGGVEAVRLETISIKNFRAYRKPQTFALGADVTVLYGPNGFGKTSFFDAIDFAVTGGIGRIEVSESQFAKVAHHLDAASEDSEVSVTFSNNGVTRRVTRNVKNRKDAVLDDRPVDRKTILAELTGRDIPAADRVENFVNLFRATHLFNQESQELTKHFRDDCCLPAEIVSRMLAFQDYTNAISKTAKLCDLLTNFITDAKREISELSQKIADENAELLRLMSSAKTHSDPDSLTAEFASVRDKLALIGISTIAGPPSLDSTRFWRASIETRLSESQRRSGQLSQLVDDLSQLPKSRSELADKQMQLSKKEAELTEAEKNRSMAEESLKVAERRMAELNSSLEAAQNRLASLNWHKANKPVYVQLLNKNQILTEDLGRIALLLPSLRIAQESASNEFKSLETVSKQISSKIDGKINAQNTVNRLIGELPTWQTNQTKLTSFAEAEAALQTSVKALGALEIELLPQISKAREESARLTRQVNEADKNQGELKVLLSQIQSYIESGTCPLCGEDHGAKNELLSRVQRNLQSDSAGSARIDLGVVREKISRLERDLADVKEKQQSTTDQIAVMKREQLALDTQINDFLREVADVGFLSDAPSNLAAFLDQIAKDIENEISVLKSQLRNTNDSLETLKSKFVATQDALSKELHEEAEKKALFIRNAEELSSLRNDSRWKQFSLDIADDQRVNEEQGLSAQLTQIRAEMGNAQTALPKLKEQHAGFRQTHTAFKDQAQVLRTSLIALQKSIAQTVVKLEEAKIPTGITREQILELVAQETRHQSQLTALRDSATSLELALDAVTTSAALTTMQQNVRNKEKFVTTATQKLNQYQPLLTYFSKVSRLLSNQQNDSIANFTNEYGPRTSVIQRRLRSVYGFDELEIQSRESTIRVRVKRNEQELRPTDYFSQSQQQTLLLGLFLTACISQTWSGFSPVFMDDPVTHFDDLNTYAFLDLIIGLLESDSCRRQFIISTCDEKLLQLALQKFGHLGGRAAFYRFDSIGSDGPVVARINHE